LTTRSIKMAVKVCILLAVVMFPQNKTYFGF
jgi:hypothetical protein